MKNMKIINKIIFSSFTLIFILVFGFVRCTSNSFSEDDAKKTIMNFYDEIKRNNCTFSNLYPDFRKINNILIISNNYSIKEVFKKEDGEFEVLTDYFIEDDVVKPISFVLEPKDGKLIIKSSKGLSYHYYDNTFDYGVKMNYFIGNETDVELNTINERLKIKSTLNSEIKKVRMSIAMYVFAEVNIEQGFSGIYRGAATIKNLSKYDLQADDFTCLVKYFDESENLVNSNKIFMFSGLKSGATHSETIFPTGNFSQYSIEFTLNDDENVNYRIGKHVVDQL
jgi:hypothetical protein